MDRLRPDVTFQSLLKTRIAVDGRPGNTIETLSAGKDDPDPKASAKLNDINAAYLLLDNTFGKQWQLSDKMMKPKSDPEHYARLEKEIEEAPDRSFMARLWRRISGRVRMR